MDYTTTRSELVKLVKTGKVHSGYHTSGGCHVEAKVGEFVSLSGSWSEKKKSGCRCGENTGCVVDVVRLSTDGLSMCRVVVCVGRSCQSSVTIGVTSPNRGRCDVVGQ